MVVNSLIDVSKFEKDVDINPTDINTSFIKQASLFAYYASLHFKATQQASNAKINRDVTKSKVDAEIREKNEEENRLALENDPKAKTKSLTVDAIDALKMRDPRVITAVKNYNDSEAILSYLGNVLEAFKQRRDMLISLGATVREEMKGDLRMGVLKSRSEELIRTLPNLTHLNITEKD